MRARFIAGAFALSAFVVAAAASCSLGLDEGLIGRDSGAPVPTNTTDPPDGTVGDSSAPVDSSTDGANGVTCTRDDECPSTGCLKGRCDTTINRCFFDVCPQADRCKAAACDTATNKCGAPTNVRFHEEMPLADNLTMSGPYRAMALVAPFVFVSTQSGVYAYSLQEAGPTKTPISVSGVPFQPQYLFSSGRRLYFVGQVQGGTQRRLAMGWLDVPTRGLVTELRAESKLVAFNGQAANVAFPAPSEKILLGQNAAGYAFTVTEPPFTLPISLQTAVLQPSNLVVTSGDRLVQLRAVSGVAAPVLALVTGAGTALPQQGPDQAIPAGNNIFYSYANGQFAVSPKGAVAMSWPMTIQVPPFSGSSNGVRISWLLDDDKDTTFSSTDVLDYLTFPAPGIPVYSNLAGPIAFSDENTLFATFATPSAPTARTTVSFVPRRGATDAGAADAGPTQTNDYPIQPPYLYGIAGAPGLGTLATYNPTANTYSLHVFHQGCAP